jgi:Helicase associated domain
MLHIRPMEPDEQPPVPRTQADKWATNLAAARQFHAREGHLHVPRKHTETVNGAEYKLGMFLDNARRRADKLTQNGERSSTRSACAGKAAGHRARPGPLAGVSARPCVRLCPPH